MFEYKWQQQLQALAFCLKKKKTKKKATPEMKLEACNWVKPCLGMLAAGSVPCNNIKSI